MEFLPYKQLLSSVFPQRVQACLFVSGAKNLEVFLKRIFFSLDVVSHVILKLI